MYSITVKELVKVTMKNALKKIDVIDVKKKFVIDNFDKENITRFRSKCKTPKLRNISFRLIHNGFFTHVRMKKYKMTETDECSRCGNLEKSRHLLWECKYVKNILMNKASYGQECINNYEDIFQACEKPSVSIIKICNIKLYSEHQPLCWFFFAAFFFFFLFKKLRQSWQAK